MGKNVWKGAVQLITYFLALVTVCMFLCYFTVWNERPNWLGIKKSSNFDKMPFAKLPILECVPLLSFLLLFHDLKFFYVKKCITMQAHTPHLFRSVFWLHSYYGHVSRNLSFRKYWKSKPHQRLLLDFCLDYHATRTKRDRNQCFVFCLFLTFVRTLDLPSFITIL